MTLFRLEKFQKQNFTTLLKQNCLGIITYYYITVYLKRDDDVLYFWPFIVLGHILLISIGYNIVFFQ